MMMMSLYTELEDLAYISGTLKHILFNRWGQKIIDLRTLTKNMVSILTLLLQISRR